MSTPTITPEVGKRYVTRGGWITPPLEKSEFQPYPFTTACKTWTFTKNGYVRIDKKEHEFDLVSEYVEPSQPYTFRRDLIARLYVAMVGDYKTWENDYETIALCAIDLADTLIEAMEAQQ